MSTIRYCDNQCCTNNQNNYDNGILSLNIEAAEKLKDKKYITSEYDVHICKECVDSFFNEESEYLAIDCGVIQLGKDFK